MSMEILKHLPSRLRASGKRDSWAIFKCSFCGGISEKNLSSKRNLSCGCMQHLHPGSKSHKVPNGDKHHNWKGGVWVNSKGYKLILSPGHPKGDNNGGYVYEHILVAEKSLGKFIPEKAVVHHIDLNPLNNDPSNLVICQDREYHQLLHVRTRSLKATGDPNFLRCFTCKQYFIRDEFCNSNESVNRRKGCTCKKCRSDRHEQYYAINKEKESERKKIFRKKNIETLRIKESEQRAKRRSINAQANNNTVCK